MLGVTALPARALPFSPAAGSPFATGTGPGPAAIGDVDGDGDLDVVTANFSSNSISVLLSDGAGTLTPRPGSPYPTGGTGSFSTALVDLDGDGDLDVATANFFSNNVSVLLNDGTGAFTPKAGSPFAIGGTRPQSIGAADLDGDGDQDLVTANSTSNNVSVLLNDGSAGFSPKAGSPFATGTRPFSVSIGDVDGDGDLDVVTANSSSNNVSVLLNDGAAGFTPRAGSPFASGGTTPRWAELADLDGDGDLDLVVGHEGSDNVSVLLNDGTGSFTPRAGSPFPSGNAFYVEAADFDGDGDLDLAVAPFDGSNPSLITILLNDGTGGFSPDPGPPILAGANSIAVTAGDLNGDGKPDLVVSNFGSNNVSVFLDVSPDAATIATQVSPTTVNVGQTFTDTATVTGTSGGPVPTGTVTFTVFFDPPGTPPCSGTSQVLSPAPLSPGAPGNPPTATATSAAVTAAGPGTYRFVASYSGDANYTAIPTTACGEPNENVAAQGVPTIATRVSSTTVNVGQTFTDTAIVTGTSGGPAPTGTVTFTVFFDPPGAPPCSGPAQVLPASPLTPGPAGNPPTATATSSSVTAAGPGTYRFVASYSGDANYAALPNTACGEPNENVTVRAATTLATQATSTVLGGPITDTATIAGGSNPTGTITFNLFGPDNPTCAGPPIFVSIVPVNGNGDYTSAPFTPAALGSYRWVVTYSGDANNLGVTSPCNAANETSTVTAVCAAPPPPGTLPGNTIIAQPGVVTVGTAGDDVIYGTSGNDRIASMGGNDIIFGMGGDDQISGGAGNDTICGGDGNDQLSGNDGDDFLSGDEGNDDLTGGAGDDELFGGPGADRLSGAEGFDRCAAGGQPGDATAGCEAVT